MCVQLVTPRECCWTGITYESLWGFRPLMRNLWWVIRWCWTSFVVIGRGLKRISKLRALGKFIGQRRRLKEVVISQLRSIEVLGWLYLRRRYLIRRLWIKPKVN